MDWNQIIRIEELAALVHAEYVPLVPAIHAGLAFFLGGLPELAQQTLFIRLVRGGAQASPSLRLGILARSSPVLHKLGQTLARNQCLDPALRHELQQLESLPPTLTRAEIEAALVQEIGPLDQHHILLAPVPLAEASVAVVIAFARTDWGRSGTDPDFTAVFKLLKPGIEARLHLELELLERVGRALDLRCDELDIPPLSYQETFATIAQSLGNEIRLDQEQAHLREAAARYAGQSQIRIPRLLTPCTSRLTAMERVRGCKLDPQAIAPAAERRRLAELAVRALLVQQLFSTNASDLFHGDPHAGNLFRSDSGQLALFDWSLVGHLDTCQRAAMSRIMLAALTGQTERIAGLIEQLAIGPVVDAVALRDLILQSLGSLNPGRLPGFSWVLGLLDTAAAKARIRFPADLLLFRKALLSLGGVIAVLSGDQRFLDTVLRREFAAIFAAEWPWRWLGWMPVGAFTTRLSNDDLLAAILVTWGVPEQWPPHPAPPPMP